VRYAKRQAANVRTTISKKIEAMQKTRLQMIVEECSRDLAEESASDVSGYYLHQGKWWNVADSTEVSANVRDELNKCSVLKVPYRATRSKVMNFPLDQINAVVRASFPKPVRRKEQIHRVVLRSFRNASNDFAVKYNPKTGLLSQSAFKEVVVSRLSALSLVDVDADISSSVETVPGAVCVLALDIDHFKQVNDTHGHAYGDLVIRSFGIRIEKAVSDYCASSKGRLHATCAHVSGEEFFCVAWGEVPTADFEGLAKSINAAVGESSLPSEEDLRILANTYSAEDLQIPAASQRSIHCSIGGTITGAVTDPDLGSIADKLMSQSDLALYRSKNHGRNRSSFFSAIMQQGGRVLEYKEDVGVCVIDIGSEVGVVRGQEFTVFHPDFAGNTPYIVDDGRSKKILGVLPKTPLCTINVFDVQRRIAFCSIVDHSRESSNIPRHSVLEAIPLGTLAAPPVGPGLARELDHSLEYVLSLGETDSRTNGRVSPDDSMSFAVICIRNEREMLSRFGPAFINRGLASACRHLQGLKSVSFLGQLAPTQLLAGFPSFGKPQLAEIRDALAKVEYGGHKRTAFVVGVYSHAFPDADSFSGVSRLESLKDRVNLARFAALPEAQEPEVGEVTVTPFTQRTPLRVFAELRRTRDFDKGIADYQNLVKMGIDYAGLDNAVGLIHSAKGDYANANASYSKAYQADPTSIIYGFNAMYARTVLKDMESAQQLLSDGLVRFANEKFSTIPVVFLAYTQVVTYVALRTRLQADIELARLWLDRALQSEVLTNYRSELSGLRVHLAE
jgi:diguanylate cyclase (GGDEF)-like protein